MFFQKKKEVSEQEQKVNNVTAILMSRQYKTALERLSNSLAENNRALTDTEWTFVEKNTAKVSPYATIDTIEAIGEAFLHGISYEEYVDRAGVDPNSSLGRTLEASNWWIITAGILSDIDVRALTKQVSNPRDHMAADARFLSIADVDMRTFYQKAGWFRTKRTYIRERNTEVKDEMGEWRHYYQPEHYEDIPLNERDCLFPDKIIYQRERPFYTWEQMQILLYALTRNVPIDTLSDETIPAPVLSELFSGLCDGIDLSPFYMDFCDAMKRPLHGNIPKENASATLLRAIHFALLSGVSEEKVKALYRPSDLKRTIAPWKKRYPNAGVDELLAGLARNRTHEMEQE